MILIKKIAQHIRRLGQRPPLKIRNKKAIHLSTIRPVDIERITNIISLNLQPLSTEKIEHLNKGIYYLKQKRRASDSANFFVASLRAIGKTDKKSAVKFGRSHIFNIPDQRAVKTLVQFQFDLKVFEDVNDLLGLMGPSPWKVKIKSTVLKKSKNSIVENEIQLNEIQNKKYKQIHFLPAVTPPLISPDITDIKSLKVACVLDDFSYSSFRHEANFMQLSVGNYKSEIINFEPDLLFIESAWRGKDGKWGSKVGHADFEILDLLNWCKENSVHTAFWNKEDPVHFKSFLNVAKLFNFVFTTDMDCIQRYKQALGHNRVFCLPFAFQPKIHNPLEEFRRIEGICFAGAYYKKYQQRNKDFESILKPINDIFKIDIYDRNYLDDNPDYSFPEKFSKFIVGTLDYEDINLAYKGYDIGLNLNTIKNSQTMFARRIFELIASNTLVFSNYSRGVKLLFGDLVFCSDSGDEILSQYNRFSPTELEKLKLNALRKVFTSHTYEHRFRHILSKIMPGGKVSSSDKKTVLIVALVKEEIECEKVVDDFKNQTYENKKLIIFSTKLFKTTQVNGMKIIHTSDLNYHFFDEILDDAEYLCAFDSECSYGKYFVEDLYNATKYSPVETISKSLVEEDNYWVIEELRRPYSCSDKTVAHASLFHKSTIMNKPIIPTLQSWKSEPIIQLNSMKIDKFNYSRNKEEYEYLECKLNFLTTGVEYDHIQDVSDQIQPDEKVVEGHYYSSAEIYQQICDNSKEGVTIDCQQGMATISSELGQGEFTYLYWADFMKPKEIIQKGQLAKLFLDSTPGLRMMLAVIYYDKDRIKIGSTLSLANSNITAEIPDETAEVKLAFRIYQNGFTQIKSLDLFERSTSPNNIILEREILVISNNYPSYDEKYKNGFLHSRLVKYRELGIHVDMFVLKKGAELNFREYEGVDVMTGSQKALSIILQQNQHKKIAVHFLDHEMWGPIKKHHGNREILIWVHGAEIQPWHRRIFNYENDGQLQKAKVESEKRVRFWKPILNEPLEKLKFIFVSQYFADEVMEDYGVKLSAETYEIIHNPIDTAKFQYHAKPDSQRKKLLSIRPYASKKYANDLTVKALIELSKKKFFDELEIMIIGDGKLFESTLKPLLQFDNIKIKRGFLSHDEIANIHKEYGVFITPTRMDSQGVSRDEAMASGLIPITNSVTAIPEFVDKDCGILVDGEDYTAMASGIERIYSNPDEFQRLSKNAAKRVRNQSDSIIIIERELRILSTGE